MIAISALQLIMLILAPVGFMVFSFISAYVMRFGMPRSGINFDYILFAVMVILGGLLGGAL